MMRRCVHIALLVLIGLSASAQQDAVFTQYMFNPFMFNPAYAGSQGDLSTTVQARYQWQGMSGSGPKTFAGSGHMLLANDINGVGVSMLRDELSILKQTVVQGAFSHRLIFRKTTLAMGISGGVNFYEADYSQLQLQNASDQSFNQSQRQTKILPNFGAGLFYYSSKFYLGLSLPRFINNPLNDENAKMRRSYYFNSGYVMQLSKSFKLKPNIQLRYTEGAPVQADINANLLIYEVLWFGVSYRSLESLGFLLELNMNEKMRLGYSYDLGVGDFSTYHNGSHEFMLSYKFIKEGSSKEAEKTYNPRYF